MAFSFERQQRSAGSTYWPRKGFDPFRLVYANNTSIPLNLF